MRELNAGSIGLDNNPFYKGLKFDDLKEYVKTSQSIKYNGGTADSSKLPKAKREMIDDMNLEQLKLFFESEHRRREDLETYALRTREKAIMDELNGLKVAKSKARETNDEYEAELGELMGQFAERKDMELKAKYEVDEINKTLRLIEKSKLSALENDKKREL